MAENIDRELLLRSIKDDVAPFNVAMVFRHIHNAPVADVAPVVHGRLVREVREVTDAVSVKGWACSVCGGFVKNQPVDRWRYCPFCGTPFDGGDLDGQKV